MKKVLLTFLLFTIIHSVCIFAAEKPKWVDNLSYILELEEQNSDYLYSVGYGKSSSRRGSQIIAESQAKADLSNRIKEKLIASTETFLNDSGIAETDDPNLSQAFQSVNQLILSLSNNKLSSVRTVDKYIAEDGFVYVLVRMPRKNLLSEFDKVAKKEEKQVKNNFSDYANQLRKEGLESLRLSLKDEIF